MTTTTMRTAISLFAGAGGDTLGLERAGFTVVAYNENNPAAIATHQAAFPHSVLLRDPATNTTDITKVPDAVFEEYTGTVDLVFGGAPCFVAGTLVLTQDGYKPIETVGLSDRLLTHTGTFQPILNLQSKPFYTGALHHIRLKYHPTPITATEEHPFYVRSRSNVWDNSIRQYRMKFGEPHWKVAKEITANDHVGMVINREGKIPTFTIPVKINSSTTDEHTIRLDLPHQWYFLGYFVGNGWAEKSYKEDGRPRYSIRFAIPDKKLDDILPLLKLVLPLTEKDNSTGACSKWGCSDSIWWNILQEFGCYAQGKKIPEWVHAAPNELITEFITGYVAADGNIHGNSQRISTVSPNLAFGLQRLYLKLGHIVSIQKTIRPATTVIEGRTVNQQDTYTVDANLNKQKHTSSFIEGDYAWFAVKENHMSKTVATTVYNFEVATDNSYIVENAIVHNCQGFSHAGKKRASDPRNELVHQMARVLKIVKPRWMIFENVKGLLSRRGYDPFVDVPEGQTRPMRPVIQIIQEVFMRAGYMTTYRIVDVRAVGVPQIRKRLIVAGFRSTNFYPHIDWPVLPATTEEYPTLRPILTSTLAGAVPLPVAPPEQRFLIATTETVPTGTPHPNLLRLASGIRNLSSKERAADPDAPVQTMEPDGLISFGARSSSYHGEVMDPDGASKTIICTYNLCPRLFVGLRSTAAPHTQWVRCLTVPELGQVQGFPADYPWQGGDKEAIKQIGNAVPPALAETIARALLNMRGLPTPQLPPSSVALEGDDSDDEVTE